MFWTTLIAIILLSLERFLPACAPRTRSRGAQFTRLFESNWNCGTCWPVLLKTLDDAMIRETGLVALESNNCLVAWFYRSYYCWFMINNIWFRNDEAPQLYLVQHKQDWRLSAYAIYSEDFIAMFYNNLFLGRTRMNDSNTMIIGTNVATREQWNRIAGELRGATSVVKSWRKSSAGSWI